MIYPNTGINYDETNKINEAVVHWNLGIPEPYTYVVVSFGLAYMEEGWYFDENKNQK